MPVKQFARMSSDEIEAVLHIDAGRRAAGLADIIRHAALRFERSEIDIVRMLAAACESAKGHRLALAQMERFETATRPTDRPSQQSQYENDATQYAQLGAFLHRRVEACAAPAIPEPCLFDLP